MRQVLPFFLKKGVQNLTEWSLRLHFYNLDLLHPAHDSNSLEVSQLVLECDISYKNNKEMTSYYSVNLTLIKKEEVGKRVMVPTNIVV